MIFLLNEEKIKKGVCVCVCLWGWEVMADLLLAQ